MTHVHIIIQCNTLTLGLPTFMQMQAGEIPAKSTCRPGRPRCCKPAAAAPVANAITLSATQEPRSGCPAAAPLSSTLTARLITVGSTLTANCASAEQDGAVPESSASKSAVAIVLPLGLHMSVEGMPCVGAVIKGRAAHASMVACRSFSTQNRTVKHKTCVWSICRLYQQQTNAEDAALTFSMAV